MHRGTGWTLKISELNYRYRRRGRSASRIIVDAYVLDRLSRLNQMPTDICALAQPG
jgi:hypothetical protein